MHVANFLSGSYMIHKTYAFKKGYSILDFLFYDKLIFSYIDICELPYVYTLFTLLINFFDEHYFFTDIFIYEQFESNHRII